jgi:hypothetical protein
MPGLLAGFGASEVGWCGPGLGAPLKKVKE